MLLDRVRERDGIEDVGFRIGASHRGTDVENLGPLLNGHPTLLKTIDVFCRQLVSHNNTWNFWTEQIPGGIRIVRRGTPMDVGRWPMEQYAVSYLVDIVRMAAPPAWWPEEIWIERAGGLVPSERRWLRDSRLHFDSPVTAISVPASLLALRPRAEPKAPAFVTEPISMDFVATFRAVLRSTLLARPPRLGEIGEVIGMHPRRVQRHLARQGTSYGRILEEVRLETACTRLEDTDEPIAHVGAAVGYEDRQRSSLSVRPRPLAPTFAPTRPSLKEAEVLQIQVGAD